MQLSAAESTDLFAGQPDSPQQIVRVARRGAGRVTVMGQGLAGAVDAPDGDGVVEVPVRVDDAIPGQVRPARVVSGDAELAFDPEDIDPDTLAHIVERSQKYGLGDFRPEFGSFVATLTKDAVHTAGANGDAAKSRDKVRLDAHEAFKARILVGAIE